MQDYTTDTRADEGPCCSECSGPLDWEPKPGLCDACAAVSADDLDERDTEIFVRRFHSFYDHHGPRVGDYVQFSDGVERRISHVWPDSIQTSDGGSWYLGEGFVSFSGGLYLGVKPETLTDTGGRKPGSVWFFHHDYATAGGGVTTAMDFRVFACTEAATR